MNSVSAVEPFVTLSAVLSNELKKMENKMQIPKYAKVSPIPQKTLYLLVKEQLIHNPLTDEDLQKLLFLEKIWGNREILRTQLARFSKKRRLKLIETADIPTKWERYAFSRFKNIQPGNRVTMEQVIDEIEITFGFLLKVSHIKRLYQMRKKAYNQRYTKQQNAIDNNGKKRN